MPAASHTIREEIHGVVLFVGAIWVVYFVSLVFPGVDQYGVIPRRFGGLMGIAAMPFLHANLQHLISNTIPLVRPVDLAGWLTGRVVGGGRHHFDPGRVVALDFRRPAVHIGASGLISGLAAFLILSGFLEQRIIPLLIALLVGFLYGGSLILGIVPRLGSQISWDGHLCGAIAGGLVAYSLTRGSRPRTHESLTMSENDRRAI